MLIPEQALENIGPNVKKMRKAKNMTIVELGKSTGISNPFISQIENGKRDVGVTTALKLANFFGLTIDELMGGATKTNQRIEIDSIKDDIANLLSRLEAIAELKE